MLLQLPIVFCTIPSRTSLVHGADCDESVADNREEEDGVDNNNPDDNESDDMFFFSGYVIPTCGLLKCTDDDLEDDKIESKPRPRRC